MEKRSRNTLIIIIIIIIMYTPCTVYHTITTDIDLCTADMNLNLEIPLPESRTLKVVQNGRR